jgi:hypothetical protein
MKRGLKRSVSTLGLTRFGEISPIKRGLKTLIPHGVLETPVELVPL